MDIQAAISKLRVFYKQNRRLPSYQEICFLFNYSSKNAAVYLVDKLIEAGIIKKDGKGKLLPLKLFSIPHLGLIKAGYPTTADAVDGDSLDFYEYLLDMPGDVFSLTVSGESMSDAGIHEGDIVIVDRSRTPKNGDIVAACIDTEWTVKYYQTVTSDQGPVVALVPAHKNYPALFPKENLLIGGVVVSVIRKYY